LFGLCLHPALVPEPLGDLQRFDIEIMPPDHFVTGVMWLPVAITE
jgi:hypothetical protein